MFFDGNYFLWLGDYPFENTDFTGSVVNSVGDTLASWSDADFENIEGYYSIIQIPFSLDGAQTGPFGYVSDELYEQQLEYLNNGFSETPFTFIMDII